MTPRWLQTLKHVKRVPEVWRCLVRIKNWPTLIGHFFGLPGAQYPSEVRTRSGVRLPLLELCDTLTVWTIFCKNEYHVQPGAKTIVDVGANIGAFTIWAAMAAPGAKIFSLEPFPGTFNRLIENVRQHALESRVTCIRAALAGSGESRLMNAGAMPSDVRKLLPAEQGTTDSTLSVPALALADLIERVLRASRERRIDLLKLDIEGAEHEVLPGIAPDQLAAVDAIQLEYHPVADPRPLFASLQRAGFACVSDDRVAKNWGVAHFTRGASPVGM